MENGIKLQNFNKKGQSVPAAADLISNG